MNKTGIMTFHASHNNGSMLQALALQYILTEKYELPVEIIDFSNSAQHDMYAPLPKATNIKRVIKKAIFACNYRQLQKQYEAYNSFSDRYFRLSKHSYQTGQQLAACEQDYCAVIAGSDQVWNIKCMDADDAYYLNFVKNASKYAYAVSFGANNPFKLETEPGHYVSLINSFRNISVRERNAQKWIREAAGREVSVCLDPTMLIDRKEWEDLVAVGDVPIIQGDYIFYYCFSITNDIQRFLKKISKKYRMPVYFMDAKEWTIKACWRNNIRLIEEYGPDAYMNVVKYAKIFITTSFHGTAFATIYEKCFWYLNDGGNDPEKDDRALTFLNQLHLMDRYKTIPELAAANLLQTKDYTEAKGKLAELRAASFAYLDEIVKEIKNEQ